MKPLVLLVLFLLSGCASDELIKKSAEYGNASEVIDTEYAKFRVFEHPTKKSLAVSSTLPSAFGAGVVQGVTFGAGNVLPSKGAYQLAAEAYLKKHPTFAGCSITDGYLLQKPIFEFIYSCN